MNIKEDVSLHSILPRLKYLIKRFFFTLKNDGLLSVINKTIKFYSGENKIDLEKIKINHDTKLDDIFLKFGTDKGSLDGKKTYLFLEKNNPSRKYKNYLEWINRENPRNFEYQFGLNFTPVYERLFERIRYDNLKLLEIGVANGHSAASWVHYFPNSHIYAADIKKSFKFFYKSKRLTYTTLNCYDEPAVMNYIKNNNNFNIIIEDADHVHESFTMNIKNFFKAVKPGGFYILEDFGSADMKLRQVRNFNEKHGRRLMHKWSMLMEEVFECKKIKKCSNIQSSKRKI